MQQSNEWVIWQWKARCFPRHPQLLGLRSFLFSGWCKIKVTQVLFLFFKKRVVIGRPSGEIALGDDLVPQFIWKIKAGGREVPSIRDAQVFGTADSFLQSRSCFSFFLFSSPFLSLERTQCQDPTPAAWMGGGRKSSCQFEQQIRGRSADSLAPGRKLLCTSSW